MSTERVWNRAGPGQAWWWSNQIVARESILETGSW